MADPRLIDYVRNNLKLGYTEEQLRNVLVSAGHNVRAIDDAIDTVLHPQQLKQQAPAKKPQTEKSFFEKIPVWMLIAGAGGLVLLIVIIVLLIPSSGESSGLLFQNGVKITTYEFDCAGPASTFALKVKNDGTADLTTVQLYVNDVFQPDQVAATLEKGDTATYKYAGVDCTNWLGEKKIKIVSDKATAEGSITFKCTSGACSG